MQPLGRTMPQSRQNPVAATWDEGFRANGQVAQQVTCHRFAMHSFYQDTGARSLAFSKSTDVHARSNLAIGKAFRDNRKHTRCTYRDADDTTKHREALSPGWGKPPCGMRAAVGRLAEANGLAWNRSWLALPHPDVRACLCASNVVHACSALATQNTAWHIRTLTIWHAFSALRASPPSRPSWKYVPAAFPFFIG